MDANQGLLGCVLEREPGWTEVVLTTFTNLISGPADSNKDNQYTLTKYSLRHDYKVKIRH
jgi:hypothetical protein